MKRAVQVLAVAIFAMTAGVVPVAIFSQQELAPNGKPVIAVPLDVLAPIDEGLAALAEAHKRPKGHQIAFLGDSLAIGYQPRRTVPDRLQQSLDAKTSPGLFDVHPLAAPGMGPFDFYFLADKVAAAGPDQVVLPINLACFSADWRGTFSRPQLAALLPARRVPQALLLPLDRIGLTADRVLTYFAVGQLGGLERFHALSQQQALLGNRRKGLAAAIGHRWGGDADTRFALGAFRYFQKLFTIEGVHRLTQEGLLRRYGSVMRGVSPNNATLQVLDATIRIFRSYDVDVLVYINPTNIEHLESVDALDARGLEESLTSLRDVATRAGARFLDLHDLLPDAGFRDGAGHFNVKDGGPDGPAQLAGHIAPVLYHEAQKRSRLR